MKLTKEFLKREYITMGKSGYIIAKELNIPKYTIYNAIIKFKIPRRKIRDSRRPKESKNISYHKWCNSCKLDKPFKDFAQNIKNWHNLDSYCRECSTKKARKYFFRNNKSRQLVKANLIVEFGNKCNHCGLKNLPIASYTFHHHSERMNNKTYIKVNNVLTSKNEKFISSEKSKWILLCANCHNLHHSICKLNALEIIK